jgi:hypothetical protein
MHGCTMGETPGRPSHRLGRGHRSPMILCPAAGGGAWLPIGIVSRSPMRCMGLPVVTPIGVPGQRWRQLGDPVAWCWHDPRHRCTMGETSRRPSHRLGRGHRSSTLAPAGRSSMTAWQAGSRVAARLRCAAARQLPNKKAHAERGRWMQEVRAWLSPGGRCLRWPRSGAPTARPARP